jgi:hypothetical protein
VVGDNAPMVLTVLCRTMANTLSMGGAFADDLSARREIVERQQCITSLDQTPGYSVVLGAVFLRGGGFRIVPRSTRLANHKNVAQTSVLN